MRDPSQRLGPSGDVDYERHGTGYAAQRRTDPRIAALVHEALGPARTILNVGVGAGAGSYEPGDRHVELSFAVEMGHLLGTVAGACHGARRDEPLQRFDVAGSERLVERAERVRKLRARFGADEGDEARRACEHPRDRELAQASCRDRRRNAGAAATTASFLARLVAREAREECARQSPGPLRGFCR